MERNADDMFGATGGDAASTGGTGMGSTGAGIAGNTAPSGGLEYGTTGSTGTGGTGTADRASEVKSNVDNKLNRVKDRARELQSTLADRLDAGAEKLRQRGQRATLAGATGTTGDVGVAEQERMSQVQDSVARGMSKSADWLRNGDLKADIEKQVRDNPGRTLLIALGVGYLLGKAFRGNR